MIVFTGIHPFIHPPTRYHRIPFRRTNERPHSLPRRQTTCKQILPEITHQSTKNNKPLNELIQLFRGVIKKGFIIIQPTTGPRAQKQTSGATDLPGRTVPPPLQNERTTCLLTVLQTTAHLGARPTVPRSTVDSAEPTFIHLSLPHTPGPSIPSSNSLYLISGRGRVPNSFVALIIVKHNVGRTESANESRPLPEII